MLNISRNVHKTPVSAVKFIKNDQIAASCSVDGQLVLWDMIESKEKKALTVIASIQIPVQQLKKIEKDMGVISLEYNQLSNELVLLGTDIKLKFFSVANQRIV
jgi:WD40 repeat protein